MFSVVPNCLGELRKNDTVIRTDHNSDNPFVMVCKQIPFDSQKLGEKSEKLSLEAIGLLTVVLAHRDNPKITLDYINDLRGTSRRQFNRIMKELVLFGYASIEATPKHGTEQITFYERSLNLVDNSQCADCPPPAETEETPASEETPCVQNVHTKDIKDSSVSSNEDTDSECNCESQNLEQPCKEQCDAFRFFTKWAMAIELPQLLSLPTHRQALGRASHLYKVLTQLDPELTPSKFKAFATWMGFLNQSQPYALKWSDKIFKNKYESFNGSYDQGLLDRLRNFMVLEAKMSVQMYVVSTPKSIMMRTGGIVGLLERDNPLLIEKFEVYLDVVRGMYPTVQITESTLSEKLDAVRANYQVGSND